MLNAVEGDVKEGPPSEAGPTGRPSSTPEPSRKTPSPSLPDKSGFQALSTVTAPPKFSFASKMPQGKEKFKMPGPGSYMHDRDFSSKHQTQPSFGFGTGTRKTRVVNQAPGPGTYEEPGTLGDAKISCTPRREAPQARGKAPGYEVTVFKARSGFSFGTARQRARLPAEFEAVTPGHEIADGQGWWVNAEPTKRLSSFCSWRGVWAHVLLSFGSQVLLNICSSGVHVAVLGPEGPEIEVKSFNASDVEEAKAWASALPEGRHCVLAAAGEDLLTLGVLSEEARTRRDVSKSLCRQCRCRCRCQAETCW
ncbi:unnamed protein product [Durusdinium trenchii]|uniref:Uncharacterized protein n=1 Tax=Durusdinium trenchii TaxID=1381693 RepID=A0ABP0SRA5_9DINO